MDLRHTKWKLQIAATVAYRAAAVRHLVRHSQSGGRPDWSDTDKPLRAAPKLKPPALPGDTYCPRLTRPRLRPRKGGWARAVQSSRGSRRRYVLCPPASRPWQVAGALPAVDAQS